MGDSVCYLHLLDDEGRMPEPRVRLRRVYDPPGPADAEARKVLVDGLWPRGIRREALADVRWLREIAPSAELRRWFGHKPERWEEFRRRYREELRQPPRAALLTELAGIAAEAPLLLLYGARDRAHNQAVVIAGALEPLLHGR